jgi:hypothetical protein
LRSATPLLLPSKVAEARSAHGGIVEEVAQCAQKFGRPLVVRIVAAIVKRHDAYAIEGIRERLGVRNGEDGVPISPEHGLDALL